MKRLSIIVCVFFLCASCTETIIITKGKHDNGKHKGWYKNTNNPHNPAHTNTKTNNSKTTTTKPNNKVTTTKTNGNGNGNKNKTK